MEKRAKTEDTWAAEEKFRLIGLMDASAIYLLEVKWNCECT
jgi:hypothetical protein